MVLSKLVFGTSRCNVVGEAVAIIGRQIPFPSLPPSSIKVLPQDSPQHIQGRCSVPARSGIITYSSRKDFVSKLLYRDGNDSLHLVLSDLRVCCKI